MQIGKTTVPGSAISTANSQSIIVRGRDLASELIGKVSFTEYFHLLVTGAMPTQAATEVLNATLVAIAEHGLVPSVQVSRMTFAAAPDALQGAVAAGLLGCGSVILGASEDCGRLLDEVERRAQGSNDYEDAARVVVEDYFIAHRPIPGYGHPLHKQQDPRVLALFKVAEAVGADLRYVRIAEAIQTVIPSILGKHLMLNVSAAIPAVLLGVDFPLKALRGVPILARAAGLIGHLVEEMSRPIGFALSYQATQTAVYDGTVPTGFLRDK